MAGEAGLTELRRGVLGPCVLALLELRPRFGLELVRDLAAADGLLTSDGTVYPLLNRLRDAGLVTSEWQDNEGERARRYYSITPAGRQNLDDFRADWDQFAATVGGVLNPTRRPGRAAVPAAGPDSASAAAETAPSTKGRPR
jgi:PadR family transcriptional regulator, regulatory protein PadR